MSPSPSSSAPKLWRGKPQTVAIPATRDPFVNTNLISVGRGGGSAERFWISTWNANVGPLGVLVDETGKFRVYRFPTEHDWTRGGFYSAAPEGDDTLWLCGSINRVVRLTLSTGRYEEFETGAPAALMFQGMVLDQPTGKLFAVAFPPPHTVGFSYDFRRRQPGQVHALDCLEHYMRCSFANGDGTWSFVLQVPGLALGLWDPRSDTVATVQLSPTLEVHDQGKGTTYHLVGDEAGRRYFPGLGWYDGKARRFAKGGPRPERELTWFARRGKQIWGAAVDNGTARVAVWDMASGAVREVCALNNTQLHNLNLTASGKIIAVSLYGEFQLFDGQTGALEISRLLPTDSLGHVDCLCRIDQRRLLGTPFITQRFWEVDLKKRVGQDCGRAAPGFGEVLRTWKIGGKVYMAAYTGGELLEYDPDRPARFPENPRVVADPPGGMRPVGSADDGRNLFYSCSAEYGKLGSVLTRYDTRSGAASYALDLLPQQQIQSLWYDKPTRSLLCGTTMHADCQSCPPVDELCYVAQIDALDLTVRRKIAAPKGAVHTWVRGPLGPGRWLVTVIGEFAGQSGTRCFALDQKHFTIPAIEQLTHMPEGFVHILWAGRPGLFVLDRKGAIEVWDMNRQRRLRTLSSAGGGSLHTVQDDTVYLMQRRAVVILEGALRGLPVGGGGKSRPVRGRARPVAARA